LKKVRAERQEYEEKFNRLVLDNHQKIYGLFRKMTHSHAEANDLTQETFIKVHKKFYQFKGRSSIDTWIYRIAVNQGINFLKRRKAKRFLGLDQVKDLPAEEEHNPTTGNKAIVQQAIAQLPSKQQMVVTLRTYQELPFKKIAKLMDMSENSAKVNYSHALKNLKKSIDQMGVSYAEL